MKDLKKKLDMSESSNFDPIEEIRADLISKCKECVKSSGRTQRLKFLQGKKLTHKEAIQAECFDCCCGYSEGKEECGIPLCLLYPFMPYADRSSKEDNSERIKQIIKDYEENVVTSSGRTYYLKLLKGKKLTHRQAIHAKCAECTAGYADGRKDCGILTCSLHAFMPYRGKK